MLIETVKGLALMLSLCFVYSASIRAWRLQGLRSQVSAGMLFGSFCILGMVSPIVLLPGIFFDTRSVVLAMAALFGGPVVAGIALLMAAAWRLGMGGIGTLTGIVSMLPCIALGLLYRQGRLRKRLRLDCVTLLVFGILLHSLVLLSLYLLPAQARQYLHATMAWPFLLMFSLGTVLMGLLLRDVENRVATEQSLLESSARLKAIAGSIPDLMLVLDARGVHREVLADNPRLLVAPAFQVLGKRVHEVLPPMLAERVLEQIGQALASGQTQHMQYEVRTLSGLRHFEARIRALGIEVQGCPAVLYLARDITERIQSETALRESELRFRSLLRDIPSIAVQGYRADGTTTYWNKASEQFYGYTKKEALGRNLLELIVPPAMHSAVREHMHAMFAHGIGIPAEEIQLQRKDGTLVDVYSSHTHVAISGQPAEMFRIDIDISQRKQAEKEARYLAFYDALTQLPNRRLLTERLQFSMASTARSGLRVAVVFVDLDNFKTLNDSRGHAVGDLLLVAAAKRLQACLREQDTVARLGGDEFVVLLHNLAAKKTDAATQVRSVAEKMLAVLRQPFELAGQQHHITASMGATLLHDHTKSIDEVLKQADMAMYRAKDAGRNRLCFFDPLMQEEVNQRALLESDMHHGLRHAQFVLFYQPQVDGQGRVTGAEALVRWQHPTRGLVAPGVFIPLAEESGLILELGAWVLQQALQQQARWGQNPALAHLHLAINVSARQFRQEHFVDQVLELVQRSGASPQHITLELTESLMLQDVEGVIATMHRLKAQGIGFSLDDFGTGYSSLNYLKRLPLDQIKIDQGFVRNALHDPRDAAIAHSIVTLADMLGLGVIAEGVETPEQHRCLASYGCRAFQGYLFGRPVPVEAFEAQVLAMPAHGLDNPHTFDI